MKCKFCQAELEDGVTVCPACGKEQETVPAEEVLAEEAPVEEAAAEETLVEETPAEETPAEEKPEATEIKEGIKATPGKIAMAIVAGVVVLALLVALVVSGIDGDLFRSTEETVAPTAGTVETEAAEPATEGTIPPDGNPEDVTCKGSYTVSDDEINASVDTVVAVVGDQELTIGELQVYYWESVYAFSSEWGSYASLLGLDLTQPLDTQLCETGDISMTWQQYFLDYALNTWHSHQSMALEGAANDYTLTDELREELDALPEQIDAMVTGYGFASREEWLLDYIGPGCSIDDFITYMETYYEGYGYLEHMELNTVFTADEVEAYFTENEGSYADSGVTRDAGKVVDVRHILLMPENGTTGEDGYPAYSDEDWAACEAEVQKIYNEWLEGDKSEQSFADFAVEYSEDGNAAQGGIYEGVTQGYMVEAFDSWCFDEARQPGDHGLVKTQYGYHIMYFVGAEDLWYVTAEADLLNDALSAVVPAAMEHFPMTVDYSAIKLGLVEFS